MILPQQNEKWIHFKGGHYIILGFSWGCEGELVLRVHYQKWDSSEEPVFSRTITNFLEPLETGSRFQRSPDHSNLPF